MWSLAICSYRTRFTCPLVESPLPGKSLQGSRKLFAYCLEACSIRVQQFGGKHGQSWKVAEKLKESDSYVIFCV
jgi:hypothetical protein